MVGETDERAGSAVMDLYKSLPGPMIRCPIEIAEMVKYADNAWHATKVAFANEVGAFCKGLGIDSHEVMNIFCQDTKLNISTTYLRPGFAFGGSCLPKDVRALRFKGKEMNISLPLLDGVLASNRSQLDRGIAMVKAGATTKRIGILGFSFKANTDDMRESPIIDLITQLVSENYDLRVYDKNVTMAKLTGANLDYIESKIPGIGKLMSASIGDVLSHAEVIVIGNNSQEFGEIANQLRPEQKVVDFVRMKSIETGHKNYNGIGW